MRRRKEKHVTAIFTNGLVKELGLPAALFLGFIYAEGGKYTGNVKDLMEKLGVSYWVLRRARKRLKTKGYIKEQRFGYPSRITIELTRKGKGLLSS